MSASRTSGRLRIGDEFNAISLLARTQSNPLKAVAEFVENALDAGAKTVDIARFKRGGKAFLTIADDGSGIRLNAEGLPDFAYVATHIADSIKRHLATRAGVHGEFGIGLLGFWSLGDELRLASRGADGRSYEMVMRAGEERWRVHSARERLPLSGAEVVIAGLRDTTRTLLTGEKLNRYLAAELRDRIRSRGATVRIHDRVARKAFTVRPREFEGERVEEVKRLSVPGFGEAAAELFYRVPADGEALAVDVCRDGTRVLRDLRGLADFDRPPWNANRLEGVIDFAALSVAPATREGVVPDAASVALVEALQRVEPVLVEFLRKRDEAEADHASESLQKEVQRALVAALRGLPESDYALFDVGRKREAPPSGEPRTETEEEAPTTQADLLAGPLAGARVVPAHFTLAPDQVRTVAARALDADGRTVVSGLEFTWSSSDDSIVKLEPAGQRASVTALKEGEAVLRVTVRQGDLGVRAEAAILVARPSATEGDAPGDRTGLPPYALASAPGEDWRSRFRAGRIEINSAHRDYAAARAKARTLRRYVGKLYAKEIVLLNFPGLPAGPVMERFIELMMRVEERL
ncbi:MAG: ATP-binding protein [Planctomycetes bacterium]|nr:ATP-binding protein [Planctomycetota bacterium]